ncbi:uncharacterized protein PHALS_07719 [Plasmopara halstedii]|uniref:Uncharacterized protein n=1 Tax=Plasmopara halstedii TaxID=4781 RepID=A0A0P1B6T7_PLAHL|nr:uncharacterized protein PHALS_07719 [Plasmopara halstedii]CEG49986.1 hypothetical protein PHALS_07719 [Plasmopara halstedii]|eukprot:XP_024586355.1 hypothetical protein PHALS_07719 [Plasmopara halstedii]
MMKSTIAIDPMPLSFAISLKENSKQRMSSNLQHPMPRSLTNNAAMKTLKIYG